MQKINLSTVPLVMFGSSTNSRKKFHLFCFYCKCMVSLDSFFFLQVEGIKEFSDLITKLKRAGDGLGIHILDKEYQ